MAIYAIGDLHLPGKEEKPMNVFGSHWDHHFEIIQENWLKMISDEDIVLIPGDISWAMHMEDAKDDLDAIAALPGQKLILRGNHDYWWSSLTKLRAMLPENMDVIQNNALRIGEHVFCGTRGWNFPLPQQALAKQDEKIYLRELLRLKMSLDAATAIADDDQITVMMHYPPLFADGVATAFTDLIEQYDVARVVYGHLHGAGIQIAFNGERRGIDYRLVSCDALHFSPLLISES